ARGGGRYRFRFYCRQKQPRRLDTTYQRRLTIANSLTIGPSLISIIKEAAEALLFLPGRRDRDERNRMGWAFDLCRIITQTSFHSHNGLGVFKVIFVIRTIAGKRCD